jgi:glycosyltransferase involved in cell wall biosynthesis
VRVKERGEHVVARTVARSADAIVAVSDAIRAEAEGFNPRGPVVTIANGSDFDDFAGLPYTRADRFRITHTGSFFGKRSPRPFLTALAGPGLEDVVARFVGDFRSADREWAESLQLGGRLELHPFGSRRRALELQRDSDALLLLIPEAAGRGRGVLSGKVFEYLAAERPILASVPPDGAAAELIRETGTGVVVPPDDPEAIGGALRDLVARWRAHELDGAPLPEEVRAQVSRESRVRDLAELLWTLE